MAAKCLRSRQTKSAPRLLLVAATVIVITIAMMLSSCGGNSASTGGSQPSGSLSGNWQFTLAPQTDGSSTTFTGGLLGGFLLQNNAQPQAKRSTPSRHRPDLVPCNSGSAPITATISGQNVTLTEVAGTQTYTLTGTLSSDGSTMMGTYTSTAGTAPTVLPADTPKLACHGAQYPFPHFRDPSPEAFTAPRKLRPRDQDFIVSGVLTQGQNIGASNATVTGTLNFTGYPCFSTASVNGQISGNSVLLQLIGTNGATVGQIGQPAGSPTNMVNPVTFISVTRRLRSAGNQADLHGGHQFLRRQSQCRQWSRRRRSHLSRSEQHNRLPATDHLVPGLSPSLLSWSTVYRLQPVHAVDHPDQ
jgi:hypothetical protein